VEFDSTVSQARKQNNFLCKVSVLLSVRAQLKTVIGQEAFPSSLQLFGGELHNKGTHILIRTI